MKRRLTSVCALAMTLLVGGTSVFACTTTPKNINTSKPGAQLEACVCQAPTETPKEAKEVKEETKKEEKEAKKEEKEAAKEEKEVKQEAPKGAFKVDNFQIIQASLQKLGIEPEELETLIKEGKKLPEILEMKEITVKKFKKVLLKEYYKVIEQGVKDKQITKTQGKMLKEAIKEKIDEWMVEPK